MGMIDIIKQAGVDAVGAGKPVEITFGEVLQVDDLKIKIDQKLILDKDFLIIPEYLSKYEVDLLHKHTISDGSVGNALGKLVIREGLKKGDTVILLRVQGGQQYVVLDKAV